VKQEIEGLGAVLNVPKEAWCAAHLNMLCNSALKAYESYGTYNDSQQRGFLVNYDSLPGSVARLLLPSFGVEPSDHWLSKMAEESMSYSKGRGISKLFFGDSKDKDDRATAAIQQYSTAILLPTFEKLSLISSKGLESQSPELFKKISITAPDGHALSINWKSLKDVPVVAPRSVPLSRRGMLLDPSTEDTAGLSDGSNTLRGQHSNSFKAKEFLAWAPFSNTHSSRPVQVI
jgi:hypothetical protein